MVFALVRDRSADGLFQVVEIIRDEVRQIGVLRMVPALFHGV